MKTLFGRSTAIAAAFAAIVIAAPVKAAEKLIYATYFSDVYSASKTDLWFMAEVEKRSNGEITFEKYWNQSLMRAPELFPALRSGAADIVDGAPASYNVREYPLANILMPLTSSKADAVTLAWNKLYAQNADFRKEFESRGAKVLYATAWAENSAWSRRPIAKVGDFKGLKVRAVPPIAEAYAALGATPISMTWPEGLEGLQRGVVDAMSAAPFDSGVLGGAPDAAKYGSDVGGMGIFSMATVAISLDRYRKLSEKHRKIIDEVAAEAPKKSMEFNEASINGAVEKLCARKDKVTVNVFPPEEAEKVRKVASSPLQEAWIKRAKSEAKVDGKAMLDEFLGYVREFEKTSTYVPGFERYLKTCGSKG
ncbi:TRAP transporter substrate-binding protein DctP [Enterovirga rhinocerotis]|uniref:TRAP transporter substrate-binding protein DctP n=1 Tax=Enterovirga rhinocerotis TaxID=1339210 RepID=UPI00105E1251|nr:TRAP transporter substrate-binding protein DctP [Enterovirga rhinocerotis]